MKRIALLFVSFLIAQCADAAESDGVELLPSENGDVLVSNVYPSHGAAGTFVSLSTNANLVVFCQVFYYDPACPTPKSLRELDRKDRLVNHLLSLYLAKFWELHPDDLVNAYQIRLVADYLEGFPSAVADIAEMVDLAEARDFVVKGVSMQAVDELAMRLNSFHVVSETLE